MEFTGVLHEIGGSGSVEILSLELEGASEQRLIEVASKNRITAQNQNLYCRSIAIEEKDLPVFIKGQSSYEKHGNTYIATGKPSHPSRFQGILRALETGRDGRQYVREIVVGNIAFDLENENPKIVEDCAMFEGIRALLYVGQYSTRVL